MSDGSFLGVVGNYFPKAGAELSRGPEGHSHCTTTLCALLLLLLCLNSVQSRRPGCTCALHYERTVWPVRNVVPTTAPIYPRHKFPSKLTILTQARPTTLHTEQKPHKGSQEVGEDYIQETRDTCSTHHLPRRKPKK